MEQSKADGPTPEQVAVMTELADRIINELGRGKLEVDVCNACMLVIQLICDNSESMVFGETSADPLHQLAQHVLKHSVMRQMAKARIEMLPPGALNEPMPEDLAFPDGPAVAKKPYLN